MTAYYNEIDPFAAAWLKELIRAGHIAPGEVDTRSIEDVRADDLRGFTQCHFFAGIGVWSYALRCAGWPDDRPVWTGSCPCQPFSAAGKRGGTADERHLWPAWFHLIEICRPPAVFGEQVASKDGLAWLDLVHADLEGSGYAVGAVDLCAAGFGAPHIRQRLYFVGVSEGARLEEHGIGQVDEEFEQRQPARLVADADRGLLGDTLQPGLEEQRRDGGVSRCQAGAAQGEAIERTGSPDGRMADPYGHRSPEGRLPIRSGGPLPPETEQQGPCNGFWSSAVWLPCRDGKARPVGVELLADTGSERRQQIARRSSGNEEADGGAGRYGSEQNGDHKPSGDSQDGPVSRPPGPAQSIFQSLADGTPDVLGLVRLESYPGRPHEERLIISPLIQKGKARVGRLRGYGNCIVAPQAEEFIRAYMEVSHD